ncbi:hypothetical protein ASPZODRAFT_129994 [Penicilliopsis zonata CBS 506.65]|uniref:Clr5 domain-containing protein n=1 Tax=Penicilliopsis zonata CBS 506.65 TaxID=1073090 RepID=A0A1L9SLU5_9EURO|nr:hypothetical protein ASPZODRAFT_129994 [Penicilliopsis zonata CBS 506.65]OJJ48076.1 hypothetical protein ASPZODRAFT_129994 [Penicilliopsis zonata CBS 506.65]
MKTNTIPADVWEKKRALIARLYKDEEWPLKQVIKQIRSADFNPSETQLRSRLKKWRVTKPSRQTRKKPATEAVPAGDESDAAASPPRDSPPVSPLTKAISACPKTAGLSTGTIIPAAEVDWLEQEPAAPSSHHHSETLPEFTTAGGWGPAMMSLSPPDESNTRHSHSLTTSPPILPQMPVSSAYLPAHSSEPALVSPEAVMAYTGHHGYPLSPPQSLSTASTSSLPTAAGVAAPWPARHDSLDLGVSHAGSLQAPAPNWYHIGSFDAAAAPAVAPSPAPSMAYFNPPIPAAAYQMPGQDPVAGGPPMYSSQPTSYAALLQQDMAEMLGQVKPWKRAMDVHHDPAAAGSYARVDRHSRQRKPAPGDKRLSKAEYPGQMVMGQQYGNAPQLMCPVYPPYQ